MSQSTYTYEELLAAQAQAFSQGQDNMRLLEKVIAEHGEEEVLRKYRAHLKNAPDTCFQFNNPYAFQLHQRRKQQKQQQEQ